MKGKCSNPNCNKTIDETEYMQNGGLCDKCANTEEHTITEEEVN